MFDPEMKKLTLGVRFPAEYPLSPPEVWLRRPRMRHSAEHAGPLEMKATLFTLFSCQLPASQSLPEEQ